MMMNLLIIFGSLRKMLSKMDKATHDLYYVKSGFECNKAIMMQ